MSLYFDWPKLRSQVLKLGNDWLQICGGGKNSWNSLHVLLELINRIPQWLTWLNWGLPSWWVLGGQKCVLHLCLLKYMLKSILIIKTSTCKIPYSPLLYIHVQAAAEGMIMLSATVLCIAACHYLPILSCIMLHCHHNSMLMYGRTGAATAAKSPC